MEKVVINLKKPKQFGSSARFGGIFKFTCFDKNGKFKWVDTAGNIVTNEGLQKILDVTFNSGVSKIDKWFIGITDTDVTTGVAAGDIAAQIGGTNKWAESTAYSGDRKLFSDARTNQTVSNTASAATFTMTGSLHIGGAFLNSDSNKSTTAGTLLCVAAFTDGHKSLDPDDSLVVTYQFTAQDIAT